MLRLALAAFLLAITSIPANSANVKMITESAEASGPITVTVDVINHVKLDGIKAKGDPQVTQAVLQSMVRKLIGIPSTAVTCLFTPSDEVQRDRGRNVRGTGSCWVDGQDLAKRLVEIGVAEPAR